MGDWEEGNKERAKVRTKLVIGLVTAVGLWGLVLLGCSESHLRYVHCWDSMEQAPTGSLPPCSRTAPGVAPLTLPGLHKC